MIMRQSGAAELLTIYPLTSFAIIRSIKRAFST